MGYEGNDRDRGYGGYGADRGRDYRQGYGRDEGRNRGEYGGRDYGSDRSAGRRDYGGDPRGYDYQDRGLFDRAGDEVRSWFGDDEAERRRQADERYDGRRDERGGDRGHRGFDPDRGRSTSFGGGGRGDAGYGAGYYGGGSQDRGDQGRATRGSQGHDPNYRSWRDRQMDSFDRDYDEYRREHQSRFESEFKTWREGRQGQRDLLGKVKEHAEVVGSDGQHVGTVDHVRGDQIELTKSDKDAGGRHHIIPSSWLQSVEENKVMLAKTADQAKQHWRDEARDAGGGDRNRSLDRSFSGTY